MPDCELSARGPDIPLDRLVDATAIEQPLDQSLLACLEHQRAALETRLDVDKLSPRLADRFVELVRGDFAAEVTAASHVLRVAEKRLELTEEQRQTIARLAVNPRVVATGSAGTGKTVLALDEARRLAADGHAVLLLCFNRRLADWLDDQLADNPDVDVATIHQFAFDLGGQGWGDDKYEMAVRSAVDKELAVTRRATPHWLSTRVRTSCVRATWT